MLQTGTLYALADMGLYLAQEERCRAVVFVQADDVVDRHLEDLRERRAIVRLVVSAADAH